MEKNKKDYIKAAKINVFVVCIVLVITFIILGNASSTVQKELNNDKKSNTPTINDQVEDKTDDKEVDNNTSSVKDKEINTENNTSTPNNSSTSNNTSNQNNNTNNQNNNSSSNNQSTSSNSQTSKPVETTKPTVDNSKTLTESKITKNGIYISNKCGDVQAQVIDEFYQDDKYVYYFNTLRSNCIYVGINGAEFTVKFALNEGKVTMAELEKAGFSCLKKERNLVTR